MKIKFKYYMVLILCCLLANGAAMFFSVNNDYLFTEIASEINILNENEHIFNINDAVVQNSVTDENALDVSGTIINNSWVINFAGEANPFTQSSIYNNKSQVDLFNDFYNTTDTSVKGYYNQNSNGNLNLHTEIITDTNPNNIKVFTLSSPREYYMNYYYRENGSYIRNAQGYFDYVLVQSSTSVSNSAPQTYGYDFYRDSNFIANVYDDRVHYSIPEDTNISDKIISYQYAQTLASSHGNYYLVKSDMRYYREWRLLCEIMEQAAPYMTNSGQDYNSDNWIDAINVSFAESLTHTVGWSELLWAHKINIGVLDHCAYKNSGISASTFASNFPTYLQKFGYSVNDSNTITNYLRNVPKLSNGLKFNTICIVPHSFTNLSSQVGYNSFVTGNSTTIHELGHVLGLPDLYVYSTGDASQVGSWSQMCDNPANPSFFTSYEREKLGWLNSNNVKEIVNSGAHTLNAVMGLDNQNTIAYKIPDLSGQYPNQYIYFEYRNRNNGIFDRNAGNSSGLLIYRVYADGDGNANGEPYEIEIFKPNASSISFAAFTQGQSFGSESLGQAQNVISFFKTNPMRYQNSGIVINVTNITSSQLTFNITYSYLQDAITVDDLGGNQLLYNRLNSLKQNSQLSEQSFVGLTVLDLSGLEIEDLDFLSLFDLSTIQHLNLANNKLTDDMDIQVLATMPSIIQVVLSGNLIDLTQISSLYLPVSVFDWGIQYAKEGDMYINTTVNLQYYKKSSDVTIIEVDDIELTTYNAIAYCSFSPPNRYFVTTKYKVSNPYGITDPFDRILYFASITSTFTSQEDAMLLWKDDPAPSPLDFLSVNGVNVYLFEYDFSLSVSTENVGYGTTIVTVKYNEEIVFSIECHYRVRDNSLPEVTFNGGQHVYIELGSVYVDNGLTVYESGVEITYLFDPAQLPTENNTYTIKYWSATFNGIAYNKNSEIALINTSQSGHYIVEYTLKDSLGNVSGNYLRIVTVSSAIINESSLDPFIYARLLEYTGNSKLVADDFAFYTYLDLSDLGAMSIAGLEQFEFNVGITINLIGNNISSYNDITTLLEMRTNVIKLFLIFNNYNLSDIYQLSTELQNKCVFALQNVQPAYLTNSSDLVVLDMCVDYSSDFLLSVNKLHTVDSALIMEEFGQYEITFTNTQHSITKTVNILVVKIVQLKSLETLEYRSDYLFSINYNEFFSFSGAAYDDLEIETNETSLNFLTLGEKQFKVEFKYSQVLLSQFTVVYTVVDTVKPTLNLLGDLIVYVTSVTEYEAKYKSNTCTAVDNYDGQLQVVVVEPSITTYGYYTVTYTATDSSGNSDTITRKIYIGNVTLNTLLLDVDFNVSFTLPFEILGFLESDLTIEYKLNSESIYKPYNKTNGITYRIYGLQTVNVRVSHNYNINIVYNFDKLIMVTDNKSPEIVLLGLASYTLYAGQTYVEFGYQVTDNSVDTKMTHEIPVGGLYLTINYEFTNQNGKVSMLNILDTSRIGSYVIIYTVRDYSGNIAVAERYIEITYYPIDNVKIVETSLLKKYQQGKVVELTVEVEAEYKVDPNPMVRWYIDGVVVSTVNGYSAFIQFDDIGEHIVSAELISDVGDIPVRVFSESITIEIYEKSWIETFVFAAGIIAGSITVLSFIVFFIKKYAKRNFY